MVSRKFVEAIKLDERPDYKIAHAAGIHPSTLSKIIHGIEKVKPGDARVRLIGRVVGLTDKDLFDDSRSSSENHSSERRKSSQERLVVRGNGENDACSDCDP